MNARLTRRGLLKGTAAGLLGAGLAACSGGTGSGGDSGNGDGGSGGDGTISFWQFYGTPDTPYGAALQALFDAYSESAGVKIENRFIPFGEFSRTLLQGAAGGDLPDIALISAFDTATFAEAGILTDITDRVEEWGQSGQYFETSWRLCNADGKTYGIPHVADCYVLWYDQQLLDQAGVKPPVTWAEMTATAAKLSGDGRYGLAVSAVEGVEGATAWMIRFLAEGGELARVDSPAGRTAMQQFVDLVGGGAMSRGILGWIEDDVYQQFATGKAGFMINSASYVNTLKEEQPDLQWGVALLPRGREQATWLAAENLAITSGSADPDAAWDLIVHMQQDDVLREYLPKRNKLPARKDPAAGDPWASDPIWSVFTEQLPSAWAPPEDLVAKSAELLTHVQGAVQAAVSGSSPVEAALADAQRKIDQTLAG